MNHSVWRTTCFVCSFLLLAKISFADALVPQVAEPLVIDQKCIALKQNSCPADGMTHLILASPIGGRCPAVPVTNTKGMAANGRSVLVKIYVRENGDVGLTEIAQSSGNKQLDAAAKLASEQCRFTVGTENGFPAKTILRMRYVRDQKADPHDPPEQISARMPKIKAVTLAPLPVVKPMDLHCDKPEITMPASIRANPKFTRASVVVNVLLVAPFAKVGEVTIQKSSGYRVLDREVVEAMRKMQCKPDAQLELDISATQTFDFALED